MSLNVCPADTVKAPVSVVWSILTQPAYYPEWADARLEHIEPEGPAVVGQRVQFVSRALGMNWRIIFTIEKVNPERHQLDLYATFPLGLRIKPHISCSPVDAMTSLLRYG